MGYLVLLLGLDGDQLVVALLLSELFLLLLERLELAGCQFERLALVDQLLLHKPNVALLHRPEPYQRRLLLGPQPNKIILPNFLKLRHLPGMRLPDHLPLRLMLRH